MSSITDLIYTEESGEKNQFFGFVQGVVRENNHSGHRGMVKVEFTVWEDGKNMCEWIRLFSPYAGKEDGCYFVPEIDDAVLVGFIGGSLKRPFLLGSLYPVNAEMVTDSFDEKNNKKRLLTRGGVEVLIWDEKDRQSISVTTPKGAAITVEDAQETCVISDKNGDNALTLDYKKGMITLTAAKKLQLKCGTAELMLDGNSGACTIKAEKLELSGKNMAKLTSGSQLSLKGGMAALEGSQTLKLKGGALTEVAGGLIKIG